MRKLLMLLIIALLFSACGVDKKQKFNAQITITSPSGEIVFDEIVFGGMVLWETAFFPQKLQVIDIYDRTVFALISNDIEKYEIIKRLIQDK